MTPKVHYTQLRRVFSRTKWLLPNPNQAVRNRDERTGRLKRANEFYRSSECIALVVSRIRTNNAEVRKSQSEASLPTPTEDVSPCCLCFFCWSVMFEDARQTDADRLICLFCFASFVRLSTPTLYVGRYLPMLC